MGSDVEDMVRAHVVVSGVVQGVWFRGTTAAEARGRGVGGWVRNLPDGDVEAVFEGTRDAIEAVVAWTRTGPPSAIVERVDVTWEEPLGEGGFAIR